MLLLGNTPGPRAIKLCPGGPLLALTVGHGVLRRGLLSLVLVNFFWEVV